jgi:hypothetical protein
MLEQVYNILLNLSTIIFMKFYSFLKSNNIIFLHIEKMKDKR